ncbi:EAL domain-containing protein [Bacillus sp. HNG]|uniref:EAL domain-containing protein n=1 Tax=Bacillus sp. HNG TaxID=2293325 RepID=UPI0026BEF7A9|nr:EAL domain-containing protein [Bacillus sp. HNG]
MINCRNCFPTSICYEIVIDGESNRNYIPDIIKQLKRNNMLIHEEKTSFLIKEEGIVELYDFFTDHLDTSSIRFRVDKEKWRPIHEVEELIQSQWIDKVIREQLVTCYYQPIVDVEGKVYGYEALSRFFDEVGNPIPPLEAYKAAKRRNRMYSLDRVCRMNAVQQSSLLNKKVFINFVPTSIYSPEHCLKSTVQLAQQLGIDPSNFVFEVVETEQVEDLEHLKRILLYYKEKGFNYALDDVGEGFSSIEVLRELAPNYMKLDMRYVQGVSEDKDKQETAKHFLKAAIQVGAIPLAEGIEEKEDFLWLRNMGYQLFQGYLFGKPSPHIHTDLHKVENNGK